jgi:hypothetical protein
VSHPAPRITGSVAGCTHQAVQRIEGACYVRSLHLRFHAPIGRYAGALKDIRMDDLATHPVRAPFVMGKHDTTLEVPAKLKIPCCSASA